LWAHSSTPGRFFLFRPWDEDKPLQFNLEPGDPDEELFGVRWEIKGPGARWFFGEESGIQKWMLNEKEFHLYFVSVNNEKTGIAANIHRLDFYQNLPVRRSIGANRLTDTLYKLRDVFYGGDVAKNLQTLLEERFNERKKRELY